MAPKNEISNFTVSSNQTIENQTLINKQKVLLCFVNESMNTTENMTNYEIFENDCLNN